MGACVPCTTGPKMMVWDEEPLGVRGCVLCMLYSIMLVHVWVCACVGVNVCARECDRVCECEFCSASNTVLFVLALCGVRACILTPMSYARGHTSLLYGSI